MLKTRKNIYRVGALALAVAAANPVSADVNQALADKVQALEAQLAALRALVNQQAEKQQEIATQVAKKKSNSASGTTFQYGGFVKFDAMTSDYSDGERATAGIGDDILVPSTIPVGGSDGATRFDTSVKTSRFWFKTKTGTEKGDIRTLFELDLLTSDGDERISNSSHSRIRHALVAWDYADDATLILGQTWSTFMSTAVLPEAVDFIGPTAGVIFNRQAQVRWTKKLGDGSALHLALENPSTGTIDGGGGISGNNFDDNSVPDVVVRYDGKAGDLSYTLAAVGREIAYDTGTADEEDFGFGVSLSGKYVFSNGDDLKVQINHGNLGRYVALQAFRDAAVESDGDLDLLDVTGGFIAYRHFWSKKLRSTISYAMTTADNPSSVSDTNNETVSNYAVNLFYSPVSKLSFGVELFEAERELENGDKGDLRRIQFTGKYLF